MNQASGNNKLPKTARGQRTLDKLLQAAEIEFGDKGFHEAWYQRDQEPVGLSFRIQTYPMTLCNFF
jgi:hypothetical protein